jgi:hypothetical protein
MGVIGASIEFCRDGPGLSGILLTTSWIVIPALQTQFRVFDAGNHFQTCVEGDWLRPLFHW